MGYVTQMVTWIPFRLPSQACGLYSLSTFSLVLTEHQICENIEVENRRQSSVFADWQFLVIPLILS